MRSEAESRGNSGIFRYRKTVSQVVAESPFVIDEKIDKYYILAPIRRSYVMYDAERLNVVSKGEEGGRVHCIGKFNNCILLGEENRVLFMERGRRVAAVEIPGVPARLVGFSKYIVVLSGGRLGIIEEGRDVYEAVEIDGVGKVECVHKAVGFVDKLILSGGGELYIVNVRKRKLVHRFKCFAGRVVSMEQTPNPELVGILDEEGVVVVDIRKDKVVFRVAVEGGRCLSFRRDEKKELAVANGRGITIFCLKSGMMKSRRTCEGISHMQFIDCILVVSSRNRLEMWNYMESDRPYLLREREGLFVGEGEVRVGFSGERLIASTRDRIFNLSLRREEQSKRLLVSGYGEPTALLCGKKSLVSAYTHGAVRLEKACDDVRKKGAGLCSVNAYRLVRTSSCGVFMGVWTGDSILLSSAQSGFILLKLPADGVVNFFISAFRRELALVREKSITTYTFGGEVVGKIEVGVYTDEPIRCAVARERMKSDYLILAAGKTLLVVDGSGVLYRKISLPREVDEIGVSSEFRSVVVVSKGEGGSVVVKVDIEASAIISESQFPFTIKAWALDKRGSLLVLVSAEEGVGVYENARGALLGGEMREENGASFGVLSSGRIRSILFHDHLSRSGKREVRENNVPIATSERRRGFRFEDVLDGNFPISSIISAIKEEDVDTLIKEVCSRVERNYGAAEVLLNILLFRRHREIEADRVGEALFHRERTSSKLLEDYAEVLSYLRYWECAS
jgi:hypothetical protein